MMRTYMMHDKEQEMPMQRQCPVPLPYKTLTP